MGLRFRKSIKVAPGVKLNLNKKSVGITVGTKGAHYTVNSKGKRTASVGIPGTGLSYSTTSSKKKSNNKSASSSTKAKESVNYNPGNSKRYRNETPDKKSSGNKKSNWWKWVLGIFVACGLIGAVFGDNKDNDSSESTVAIATESFSENDQIIASSEAESESIFEETAETIHEGEIVSPLPHTQETNVETSQPSSEMVWLSATGDKYHRINNCGKMNPDKATQVTLEEALSRGKVKCDKCY